MDYETKRLRIVMWTVVALLILSIGWLTHYVLTRKQPNDETKKEHRLFLFSTRKYIRKDRATSEQSAHATSNTPLGKSLGRISHTRRLA